MEERNNIIKIIGLIILIAVIIVIGFKLMDKFKNPEKEIIGTWNLVSIKKGKKSDKIDYTYTLEFDEDGKCVIRDKTKTSDEDYVNKSGKYKYYITDKSITFKSDDKDSLIYSYEFKDKSLILTIDNKQYTFEKEK